MISLRHLSALSALFSCLSLVACGGKGSPTGPSPTTTTGPTSTPTTSTTTLTYAGIFAGPRLAGGRIQMSATVTASTASLTSRPLAESSATGTLSMADGTIVQLSGRYESTTKAFTLSGGPYAVSASVQGDAVTGSYTGPGNSSGGVSAFTSGAGKTPVVYCGTFDGPSQGRIKLTRLDSTISGYGTDAFGTVAVSGTVTGSTVSMSFVPEPGHTGQVNGTLTGGQMSGTWSNTLKESGTWSAGSGGCGPAV